MKNIFTKHPHSIDETYFQHLKAALYFGGTMLMGGCACIAHALFPFVFQKTGSRYLLKLTQTFVERMPIVEERVLVISRSIEEKMKNSSEAA